MGCVFFFLFFFFSRIHVNTWDPSSQADHINNGLKDEIQAAEITSMWLLQSQEDFTVLILFELKKIKIILVSKDKKFFFFF